MVLKHSLIALVSGLLISLGFAPFELWWTPYIGLATLFFIIIDRSLPLRIYFFFLSGLAYFLPLLHWSSTYVGSIPWLALSTSQAALFALAGILPIKRGFIGLINFSLSITLIELLRMKFPFGGFGWGRIGFTQIDIAHFLFPVVGVTGATLLVSAISGSFFLLRFKFIFPGIVTVILIANLFIQPISRGSVTIAAVQGGVDILGLDFNSRALSVLNRHASLTKEIEKEDISLILWPENSVDIDPERNALAASIITSLLKEIDKPLLVGAVLRDPVLNRPKNASLLYDRNGTIRTRYIKQDLAPFGEYIPLRSIAERISPYTNRVSDFIPGKEWISHPIEQFSFISIICFEILDDDHLRKGVRNEDFLISQTNNATFGRSPQARQQLQIIRSRAAEFGREIISVSTTGVTAHIDRQGRIVSEIPSFEPGILYGDIRSYQDQTPASRTSSAFWVGLSVLVLVTTKISRVLWFRRTDR
jgi:apolipoprotein N-acyltransferase